MQKKKKINKLAYKTRSRKSHVTRTNYFSVYDYGTRFECRVYASRKRKTVPRLSCHVRYDNVMRYCYRSKITLTWVPTHAGAYRWVVLKIKSEENGKNDVPHAMHHGVLRRRRDNNDRYCYYCNDNNNDNTSSSFRPYYCTGRPNAFDRFRRVVSV